MFCVTEAGSGRGKIERLLDRAKNEREEERIKRRQFQLSKAIVRHRARKLVAKIKTILQIYTVFSLFRGHGLAQERRRI